MNVFYKPHFPKVDTALRMGCHITTDDFVSHEFVAQNFSELCQFYATYEAALIEHPDGFFFLHTDDGVIPSRNLPKSCVHIGQLLAHMAREPLITKTRGIVALDQIFQRLSTMFSAELLGKIYAPKARENGTEKQIKKEVHRALRILARLNFVTFEPGMEALFITDAINRFADVARHDNNPSPAAQKDLEIKRGIKFGAFEDTEPGDEEENDEN